MKKKYLAFLLLAIFAYMNAVPKWYSNPKSFYNSSELFVGIGVGDSYESATAVARAELIQQLSVRVQAETDVTFSSMETSDFAYYEEQINQNILTTSEHSVVGMEIMNQARDGNKYYVMVSLNKSRLFTGLESEIRSLWDNAKTAVKEAERLQADGQIVNALNNFAEANDKLTELISKKYLYDNLFRPFNIPDMLSINDIYNKVQGLVNAINLDVVSGDNQSGKRGGLLSRPITFSASLRKAGGGRVNIAELPVIISDGDGELLESGVTKRNGEYSVYAIVRATQGNRGKVVLQIDTSKFNRSFSRLFESKKVEANLRLADSAPMVVELKVKDSNGGYLPVVQSQISRALANAQMSHRQGAPFFMDGIVSTSTTKRENAFIVTANVDLEVGVSATKEVMGAVKGTGQGISNASEADAITKAYQNINIGARELMVLRQRIERNLETTNIVTSSEHLQRGKMLYMQGEHQKAIEALLQVEYGEDNIEEAVSLINEIKKL